MTFIRSFALRPVRAVALAGALSVLLTAGALPQSAGANGADLGSNSGRPKPTIVLVHGAFADASSWDAVALRLQDAGYTVFAPANPLRGVSSDAAYISSFLDTVTGPVVLVGHSYGGAVITNAAVNHPSIRALVYIAAFIPDVGQTLAQLSPPSGGSELIPPGTPGLAPTLILRPCPPAACALGVEGYIDPVSFRKVFAADLSPEKTAVMAATQRPASLVTLVEPTAAAAWKTIPSSAMVATEDHAIGTANVLAMAQHAGSEIVEIDASHVVMISHPDAVVHLIRAAADTHH